jgi:hypothetical protein
MQNPDDERVDAGAERVDPDAERMDSGAKRVDPDAERTDPGAKRVAMRLESLTLNTTVIGASMMGTSNMIIDTVHWQEAQVVLAGQATDKVLVDTVAKQSHPQLFIISVGTSEL